MHEEVLIVDNRRLDFENTAELEKAAVVVCFYYVSSFEKYIDRVVDIASVIDVYLISSADIIIDKASEIAKNVKSGKLFVFKKNNRGRDVSALLVTAKEMCRKYTYFGFCHDKAPKNESAKAFAGDWESDLFDNILSNSKYVRNVIYKMQTDRQIGLLVPPEPRGEFHYYDYWLDDYDNTCKLASDLGLSVIPDREYNPIAIGTAFWARRDALAKLIDYDWKYEDFPEEPLASDGTISHAIERIFPYVSEDAGYKTKILVSIDNAEKQLSEKRDDFEAASKLLGEVCGILTPRQLKNFNYTIERLENIKNRHSRIYIYGTGMFGRGCKKTLNIIGIHIDGFVETSKSKEEFLSSPVYGIDDIEGDAGVIVAVSDTYREQVKEELRKRNIGDYVEY